jgi:hypothetical protein
VLVWEYNGNTLTLDCDSPPSGFTCAHSGSSYTWSLSVGSGPRAFTITAKDAAGAATVSPRRTLTLGAANPPPPPPPPNAPTVSFDAPGNNGVFHAGDAITITVTVTDSAASVSTVQLNWHSPSGDRLFDLSNVGGSNWGATLQISTAAAAGPRTLTVTATDASNNRASTPPLTIQIQ